MAKFTLILGNKNYSSWSLRPWLALRQTGVAFDEIVIPLWLPGAREKILSHSPAGKVPILRHGETVIWESLAICEYLAEQLPDAGLWPEDPAIRAIARAVSHEMHGGFMAVRRAMPMNCRASKPGKGMADGVPGDIARITAIWRDCRNRNGEDGEFLFGGFVHRGRDVSADGEPVYDLSGRGRSGLAPLHGRCVGVTRHAGVDGRRQGGTLDRR